MIDYEINTINKTYNLMNKRDDRAKYISDGFNSKHSKEKKWNSFILPSNSGNSYYSDQSIWNSKEEDNINI